MKIEESLRCATERTTNVQCARHTFEDGYCDKHPNFAMHLELISRSIPDNERVADWNELPQYRSITASKHRQALSDAPERALSVLRFLDDDRVFIASSTLRVPATPV